MAFTHILVPLDGSARSASVVPYVIDVARRFKSTVRLLAVQTDADDLVHVPREERGAIGSSRRAGDPSALRRYLDILAEQFREKGLEVEADIRSGEPPAEILRAAFEWRCDLIAMATRARGGIKRLVLGSVAEEVLRESRLPVLLVMA